MPQFQRAVRAGVRLIAISLACLLPPALLTGAEVLSSLFSTDGYRIDALRAPVPQALPGAITVGTTTARALVEAGDAVLIDVLPAPHRPEGLPPTSLWMPPERRNIPGSAWLPNVGYGRLSDELEAYFRDTLGRLSRGRLDSKILIYCLADCWMSWNAARRALSYGYRAVYWYPDGTTGWEAAGLPLEPSIPVPMDQSR